MTVYAVTESFSRAVTRRGITATWGKRTRGTKDAVTGHSAETWNSTATLYVIASPLQSNIRDTPSGAEDEQRYEILATSAIPKTDRVTISGVTYELIFEPETIYDYDNAVYYRHIAIKLSGSPHGVGGYDIGFGTGFSLGTVMSNTFYREVNKRGTEVTWRHRTRITKDSITGHSTETWTNATIKVYIFPTQSSVRDTPAGEAVEQRHELYTYVPLSREDRIVWGTDTYLVEFDPQPIYEDGEEMYYRHVVVKKT